MAVRSIQSSMFQSFFFLIFLLSLLCVASILPCGRYYYEPEGGYGGNTAIKFSLQYIYIYLLFLVHHLDIIESYLVYLLKKGYKLVFLGGNRSGKTSYSIYDFTKKYNYNSSRKLFNQSLLNPNMPIKSLYNVIK